MGVTNLWSVLEPVKQHKPLTSLKGQTVAVDLSVWVCEQQCVKQMQGIVSKPYLRNLFFRISYLTQLGVNLIFVIDGEAPELKWEAMWKRQQARFPGKNSGSDQFARKGGYGKQKRSHFKTSLKECCELLDHLGVVYIQSRGEAEALCALLNSKGLVDGVITEDGDAFLYGARTVHRNFTMNSKDPHVESYCMDEAESRLDLNQEKLVSLGLLMGSDYLPKGVPGVGITLAVKLMASLRGLCVLDRLKMWKTMSTNDCIDSTEKLVKKKALTVDGFPSTKVIDEFLIPRDKCPRILPSGRRPLVQRVQLFALSKLEWPEDYTLEKVLPLVTLWDMTLIKRNGKTNLPVYLQPQRIVKARVRNAVPCYEINWNTNGVVAIHNVDCFTTIEEQELFRNCFPESVDEYENELSLKKSKSKKGRKKKEKPEGAEKEDLNLIENNTKDVNLDMGATDDLDFLADDIANMSVKEQLTCKDRTPALPHTNTSLSDRIGNWHSNNIAEQMIINKGNTNRMNLCSLDVEDTTEHSELDDYLPLAARLKKRLGASSINKEENVASQTSNGKALTNMRSTLLSSYEQSTFMTAVPSGNSENVCEQLKQGRSALVNKNQEVCEQSAHIKGQPVGSHMHLTNKKPMLPANSINVAERFRHLISTVPSDCVKNNDQFSNIELAKSTVSIETNKHITHSKSSPRANKVRVCEEDKSENMTKNCDRKIGKNNEIVLENKLSLKKTPYVECTKHENSSVNEVHQMLPLVSQELETLQLDKNEMVDEKQNPFSKNLNTCSKESSQNLSPFVPSCSKDRHLKQESHMKSLNKDAMLNSHDSKERATVTCIKHSDKISCFNGKGDLEEAVPPATQKARPDILISSPNAFLHVNYHTPLTTHDGISSLTNVQRPSTPDVEHCFSFSNSHVSNNIQPKASIMSTPCLLNQSPAALNLSQNLTFDLSACSSFDEHAERLNGTLLDKSCHMTFGNFVVESSLLNTFNLSSSYMQTPESSVVCLNGNYFKRKNSDILSLSFQETECERSIDNGVDEVCENSIQECMVGGKCQEKINQAPLVLASQEVGCESSDVCKDEIKTDDVRISSEKETQKKDFLSESVEGNRNSRFECVLNTQEIDVKFHHDTELDNTCRKSGDSSNKEVKTCELMTESLSECSNIQKSEKECANRPHKSGLENISESEVCSEQSGFQRLKQTTGSKDNVGNKTQTKEKSSMNDYKPAERVSDVKLNYPVNNLISQKMFNSGDSLENLDTVENSKVFQLTSHPRTFLKKLDTNQLASDSRSILPVIESNEQNLKVESMNSKNSNSFDTKEKYGKTDRHEQEDILKDGADSVKYSASFDDSVIEDMLASLPTRKFSKVPSLCVKRKSNQKTVEKICDVNSLHHDNIDDQAKFTSRLNKKEHRKKSKDYKKKISVNDDDDVNTTGKHLPEIRHSKSKDLIQQDTDGLTMLKCSNISDNHSIPNQMHSLHCNSEINPCVQTKNVVDRCFSPSSLENKDHSEEKIDNKTLNLKPLASVDSHTLRVENSVSDTCHSENKPLNAHNECKNSPISLANRLKLRLQGNARTALSDISKLRNNSCP